MLLKMLEAMELLWFLVSWLRLWLLELRLSVEVFLSFGEVILKILLFKSLKLSGTDFWGLKMAHMRKKIFFKTICIEQRSIEVWYLLLCLALRILKAKIIIAHN